MVSRTATWLPSSRWSPSRPATRRRGRRRRSGRSSETACHVLAITNTWHAVSVGVPADQHKKLVIWGGWPPDDKPFVLGYLLLLVSVSLLLKRRSALAGVLSRVLSLPGRPMALRTWYRVRGIEGILGRGVLGPRTALLRHHETSPRPAAASR